MPAVWTQPGSSSVGQLRLAAWMNTYIRDNILFLQASNGLLANGMVAFWGDDPLNLPTAGWGICDGGGGRLDLRDVLVRGAGLTYAVGASGGTASYTATAHGSHTVGQASAHSDHVINQPDHTSNNSDLTVGGGAALRFNSVSHNATASSHSAHSGAAVDAHGAHSAISFLPLYHARPYMQSVASGLSSTTPRTWTSGDIPTAAQLNADLRDNPAFIAAQVLPRLAMVLLDPNTAIPSPFHLADGSGGTDMRDRYFLGSGNLYAHDSAGGSNSQTIPAHINHVTTQATAHDPHTIGQASTHPNIQTGPSGVRIGNSSGSHSNFSLDGHTPHSGYSVDAHSGHDAIAITPTYRSLSFIQHLGSQYKTARTWTSGELVRAAYFNTYARDNLTAIYQGIPPIGAIMIWSGATGAIPTHWQLANGTGTVDCRDFFIVGAGGSFGSGTGGATSAAQSNHPDHVVSQGSAHTAHVVVSPNAHPDVAMSGGGSSGDHLDAHVWTVTNTHSHTGGTVTSAHSHASPVDITPPFKAYCYVQRTS